MTYKVGDEIYDITREEKVEVVFVFDDYCPTVYRVRDLEGREYSTTGDDLNGQLS
jgi:hypothetical protein